jgi:uncharacterized protein
MALRPISVLVKPASADCNLACPYCFYSPKSKLYPETKRHVMNDAVLEAMIKQLMPLAGATASFGWQGGEPTLMGLDFFKKAVELQAKYGQPGQVVSNCLQTNALLLDERWAEFLAPYKFLLGVSLDGPKEIHDYYRVNAAGVGSFDRVMDRLRLLRSRGVEFNILTLLNNKNSVRPREVYQFFVSQGFKYLQFIPCIEPDPATGGPSQFNVSPDAYGQFLCETFNEWIRPGRPNVFVRLFDAFLITHVTGEYPYCGFAKECGSYVVIEHNGDVYPCDFYVEREWLLGNIMQTPLEEIIASAKFKEFQGLKQRLAPECRDCEWLNLCYGGCLKERMTLGVKAEALNHYCPSYKRFFAHSREGFARLKELVQKEHQEKHDAMDKEIARLTEERDRLQGRLAVLQQDNVYGSTRPHSIGRNDPCPCGSGKKYKKCCMTVG